MTKCIISLISENYVKSNKVKKKICNVKNNCLGKNYCGETFGTNVSSVPSMRRPHPL